MTERRTARNFEATKKRLSEAEHLIGASLVLARDIRSEVDLLHTRSTSLEKSKSRSPPRTTTIGGKSTNTDCYFYRQKEVNSSSENACLFDNTINVVVAKGYSFDLLNTNYAFFITNKIFLW